MKKIAIFDQYLALGYLRNDTRLGRIYCGTPTRIRILSNGAIFDDLERTLTQISRARH